MSDALEPREERDEPLDETAAELRALYRRLQPPPLADALVESDPETVRVVGWMRGAWQTLEAPPAAVQPQLHRSRRSTRARRVALAVAAGLLLVAGALFLRSRLRVEELTPTTKIAGPAAAPANGAESSTAATSTVEILDVRPDQVELRSGPVRLVLLSPPPPRPAAVPSGS